MSQPEHRLPLRWRAGTDDISAGRVSATPPRSMSRLAAWMCIGWTAGPPRQTLSTQASDNLVDDTKSSAEGIEHPLRNKLRRWRLARKPRSGPQHGERAWHFDVLCDGPQC